MPTAAQPRPSRSKLPRLPKLIEEYYADLKDLAHQHVMYEMGTRPAFHNLLAKEGRRYGWTLIAEHEKKVNGTGKTIRPDGTFKDSMNLVRGYWEAKDTADNLEAEIAKKIKAGYPLTNTIFEDNATAILYQDGKRILAADMKDPAKLAELLTEFFRHIEPEIEEFEHAVDEFKQRVPDLAQGLAKKIAESHKTNSVFKKAFADFFELCRTSLNPNLSQAAVDEMLIQHILTERLIREIFDNPEFVRRNVIAAEVEKVMLAMTSQSFDRNTYLKDLDRFYLAIERAARTMTDFADKQHFLNTVYERFFQGYSVKLADTMGIVYTPQEIVDFMCASVAEVLEKEFGKHLWSDDVYIIDPCTGTGNFIVNLIRRIPKAKLEAVYRHRLFANEIMLLPYYIAALNIEHAYFEQTGHYEPFEGLCFVDTLDLAEHAQGQLGFMTQANTERVARQKRAPITVVIGNPPYNAHQESENDNNRNRKYAAVDSRIRDTYSQDSAAQMKNSLADPFVKFFRWASDRIGKEGMVAFVTNNSFLENRAFDGMRKHLAMDFDKVLVIDLKGNIRKHSMLDGIPLGERHTVFGAAAMVGVSISFFIKCPRRDAHGVFLSEVDFRSTREEKFLFLKKAETVYGCGIARVSVDSTYTWIGVESAAEFTTFMPIGTPEVKEAGDLRSPSLFVAYSRGLETARDNWVYDFDRESLAVKTSSFCDTYNAEVDRWKRTKQPNDVDRFVLSDDTKIKWSSSLKGHLSRSTYAEFDESKIRPSEYRPFSLRFAFFDHLLNHRQGRWPSFFPSEPSHSENVVIGAMGLGAEKPFAIAAARRLPDLNFFGPGTVAQWFPFYTYDEDGSNRRENITDWALDHFRAHYKDKKIDKWAIFHYVYGLLHHPAYREKYAINLKREFPRIPFYADFAQWAAWGQQLLDLHLNFETVAPYPLRRTDSPYDPERLPKPSLKADKAAGEIILDTATTLSGIPPEAWAYRLGNRTAIEWVLEYHKESNPRDPTIREKFNTYRFADYKEQVIDLLRRVVTVSVETVKIVRAMGEIDAAIPA